MKTIIFILFFLIPFEIYSQKNIDSVRNDVCNCFDNLKYNGDKLNFQIEEQRCMMRLFKGIISIQSSYPEKTNDELFKIMYSELRTKCKSSVDAIALNVELSKEKNPTKITDKSKCTILRNCVIYNDVDNTETIMQDSIQTVNYLDYGYYVKSKVKWIDSISYQVIPFEATEPVIKRHLSESLVFVYRIIDIDGDKITFELELNEDYSLGQAIIRK